MILDGEEIKRLRVAKGWNETNLAHFADCRENTITRVEQGSSTTMKQGLKIAKVLDVPLKQLIVEE